MTFSDYWITLVGYREAMIVVRSPLRLSFFGDGADLADYYEKHEGKAVVGTIDKFVYVVVNRTPMIDRVSARYSISESVNHPSELQHTRIKTALLDMEINNGIEIGSFASVPAKTGLGSSSSFTVALVKGLHSFLGKKSNQADTADKAIALERRLIGDMAGKQDQYAAAFGGLNLLTFGKDGKVTVKPIMLDYKISRDFEEHLLVFYTGITHYPSKDELSLGKTEKDFKLIKEESEMSEEFVKKLSNHDFEGIAAMWQKLRTKKKEIYADASYKTSNKLFEGGLAAGAMGGKLMGPDGGGCLLMLVTPAKRAKVLKELEKQARKMGLEGCKEIPVKLVQSGAEVLYNGDSYHNRFV